PALPLCCYYLLLLFFSITPPTPISPLFPYTTLFRSRFSNGPGKRINFVGRLSRAKACTVLAFTLQRRAKLYGVSRLEMRVACITDRKSTRLNSGHLVISYAVFCLKKKKNKYKQHRQA